MPMDGLLDFSPQLLAGVWVGADDPLLRLLNTTGGATNGYAGMGIFFPRKYIKIKRSGVRSSRQNLLCRPYYKMKLFMIDGKR
jgi:hypothetical protein